MNILNTIPESIKCIHHKKNPKNKIQQPPKRIFQKYYFPQNEILKIYVSSVFEGGVLVVGCQGDIIFLGLVNATCLATHCIEIKYRNMVIISFSPLTCVNQKTSQSTWIFEFLIFNFHCLPCLISWRFSFLF